MNNKAKKETGWYYSYAEFAKTLRTWFVAYGIGVPVLILSQDALRDTLTRVPGARKLAWLFLGGVLLQIIAALTFKIATWYLYMGELDEKFCDTMRYRISDYVAVALWLELFFDLGTMVMFAFATIWVLAVIAP